MKLAPHPQLDALCAEYLLGTLRGGARRRFETALREEPLVALRLRHWEATSLPRYSQAVEEAPPPRLWRRLERELGLSRYRPNWFRRVGFWRAWAYGATLAALAVLVLALRGFGPAAPAGGVEIARLANAAGALQVSARRSADGTTLTLKADRPILAGPNQSYELWLIASPGSAPVSLAVLGSLDATIRLAPERARALRPGAALAVSAEPAGGSPTGRPSGPVVLVGSVSG